VDDVGQFSNIVGTPTNNLFGMLVTCAQAVSLASISSLAVSLGTRYAATNFAFYDVITGALIPGVLPAQITGGTTVPWQLSILARVVSNNLAETL